MKRNFLIVQTKIAAVFFLLFSMTIFSQSKEGYWDNIRATNETISLRAGEKKVVKTSDFPEGTTELVYRITVLDDTQKLSSSLVSLLKSIPDPTGISQGTAGAMFLASTISGDDKCKFAIFSQSKETEDFLTTGSVVQACFAQRNPTNKEARVLKASSSDCITAKTTNLYFAFESNNWVMNEKIILEVVPWVNNKASRGWDSTTKNEVIKLSASQKVYSSLVNKDKFSAFFLDKISQKFTYREFSNLLAIEKNSIIDSITVECLKNTGEIKNYYNLFRNKADSLFQKGNFDEAVKTLQTEIIEKNRAEAMDYCSLGNYFLVSKQFDKAEKALNAGIALDSTEINLQLKLAHLYLFTDRVSEAKDIHKKYMNQNVNSKTSWSAQTKKDFELYKKYKLPDDNFNKILRILE